MFWLDRDPVTAASVEMQPGGLPLGRAEPLVVVQNWAAGLAN